MSAVGSRLAGAWLAARSISRSLPAPVAVEGGFRVDTGLPHETRRYLFTTPGDVLRQLAGTVREPLVFLKLLGDDAVLRALLPDRWSLRPGAWMMAAPPEWSRRWVHRPSGYEIAVTPDRGAWAVRILVRDGSLAASGRAAGCEGVFVYDQIVVDPAHRRRGLGRTVMTTLADCRDDPRAADLLVATPDGRALYESLGWRTISPYATAVIEPG